MTGTIAGLVAGIAVSGGWWSLFGFCAVVSIGIGSWRIFGAYRRLASGKEYVKKHSDAHNIALTSGAPNPEEAAAWIIDAGQLPKPTLTIYGRACTWEFTTMAACATGVRLVKIFFFSP